MTKSEYYALASMMFAIHKENMLLAKMLKGVSDKDSQKKIDDYFDNMDKSFTGIIETIQKNGE